MMYYAGIGSRETPKEICMHMTTIAKKLSVLGYTCNSGGANGADVAFEQGATRKQIFLPWDGFNNKYIDIMNKHYPVESYLVPSFNAELVAKYHPAPNKLSEYSWKLMSRNSYQVLGKDLKTPVDFVLCWTKEGKMVGGTAQALRIAKDKKIPIFNLYDGVEDFGNFIVNYHMMNFE